MKVIILKTELLRFIANGMLLFPIVTHGQYASPPAAPIANQPKSYSSYAPSTISAASPREYTLGLAGEIGSLRRSGLNATTISLTAMFGWNLDSWEAGPKISFSNQSGSAGTGSFIGVGGYGDFNFKRSSTYNLGVTGSVMLGSSSGAISTQATPSVSIAGGGSVTSFEVGGVFKWFTLRSSTTAIRLEALFESMSYGGGTTSGPILRYGLQTYF